MIAMLRNVEDHGVTYSALMFVCPGCLAAEQGSGLHMLPVNTTEHSPQWTYDGNIEAPTLEPSILSHIGPYVDGAPTGICHSYLRAGVFEFLGDCTHELAGQHVPMVDLPDWVVDDFTLPE